MPEGTTLGPALLQQLLNREPLTPEQAEALMRAWLREELPPALAGGILVALQPRGSRQRLPHAQWYTAAWGD